MANWDIFREMGNLRREIDEVFRGFGATRLLGQSFLPGLGGGEYPYVNLSEDENNLYLVAFVPGIEPQDINLKLMKWRVTISGERKESEPAGGTWHRRERGDGSFSRSVELPMGVNMEKVEAQCKNGILTVILPKVEEAKTKKIAIKTV